MAIVHVALVRPMKTPSAAIVPAADSRPRASGTVDTDSASTVEGMEGKPGELWEVTTVGGPAWFVGGAAGEADAGEAPRHYVTEGLPYYFGVELDGEVFDVAAA